MVRGVVRPEVGIRGVRGRGEVDPNGIAGMRSLRDRIGRKKFRHRETREPHQMPSGARAIVSPIILIRMFSRVEFRWTLAK